MMWLLLVAAAAGEDDDYDVEVVLQLDRENLLLKFDVYSILD